MTAHRVCRIDEIPTDEALRVDVAGAPVCLARCDGEIFALRAVCAHADVPLSEGELDDCTIECWLHGSRFDLRTGKPTGLPATEPVATFPVEIRDGDVWVDTTTTLNGVAPA